MEYILVALMTQTSLGQYANLASCQNALRSMYVAKVAPESASNPVVIKAIDTQVKYQRDYACLPKSVD